MKLEYGKQYVRRDGEVTDPIEVTPDEIYAFKNNKTGQSYAENGQYLYDSDTPNELDLVSEYETPVLSTLPSVQEVLDDLLPNTAPKSEVTVPTLSANQIQHGGTHYKSCTIQPWDYIARNKIPYLEGSAIKYLSRWRDKGGIEDLHKAIHFIEKVIELEQEPKETVP